MKGQSDRTRKTGAVPVDAIFILPTLSKPTNELLVRRVLQQLSDGWTHRVDEPDVWRASVFQNLLNLSPKQRKNVIEANQKEMGTVDRVPLATLMEFSLEYFR